MAEASRFALDLKAFAEKVPQEVTSVVNKVSIDLLTRIVLRTPVGNPSLWKSKPPAGYVGGRLRANWAVGINSPVTTDRPPDKGGNKTIAEGSATITGRPQGDASIYLTNALPYAIPVEYGWSSQAPAGMVRVTVGEFQTFVDKAVRNKE